MICHFQQVPTVFCGGSWRYESDTTSYVKNRCQNWWVESCFFITSDRRSVKVAFKWCRMQTQAKKKNRTPQWFHQADFSWTYQRKSRILDHLDQPLDSRLVGVHIFDNVEHHGSIGTNWRAALFADVTLIVARSNFYSDFTTSWRNSPRRVQAAAYFDQIEKSWASFSSKRSDFNSVWRIINLLDSINQ